MLKFFLYTFLLLSAAALAWDIYDFSFGGSLSLVALGARWATIDVGSLNLAESIVARYISPDLWYNYIVSLLQVPATIVMMGFALILYFIRGILNWNL